MIKAGLTIYAGNLAKLTDFYQSVFALSLIEQADDYVLLTGEGFELVILETEVSRTLHASKTRNKQNDTVQPRESTPLKPTYFVDRTYEEMKDTITAHGGNLAEPKPWQFHGRAVCDGYDPEGNIFQLRIGVIDT